MNRNPTRKNPLLIYVLNVKSNIYLQHIHTRTPYILYHNTYTYTIHTHIDTYRHQNCIRNLV